MSDPILLLVNIWLKNNDVDAFQAFESKVARIQARHGAKLERAIRLDNPDQDPGVPFEVHVVGFASREQLAAYRADAAMRELAAERDRIIARTMIVEGCDVDLY